MSDKRLDPWKIRQGAQACADALGVRLTGLNAELDREELEAAMEPWCVFARLTLNAGAFGYPKCADPKERDVLAVVIDFLRAAGEASEDDAIKLRAALETSGE